MIRLRSNAHMHTTFCDGKNTVEEMILAALERDFVSAGFSIHAWTPYSWDTESPEVEAAYRAEVRRLREKYADRIEILLGIERDALYSADYSEYDYYLDSAHFFRKDGELLCVDYSEKKSIEYVDTYFGGDWYAYTRAYFESEAEICAASKAAFIGHIDLVSKFNEGNRYFDMDDPRYTRPAIEAVDCALDRGIPLEMNSGAISRGYRATPYPCLPILKRIRERNGEIIINSDAHAANAIDCAFDLCVEIARSCGFDHALRLRKSGFEEVPLQ